jgi:hypothetical protein
MPYTYTIRRTLIAGISVLGATCMSCHGQKVALAGKGPTVPAGCDTPRRDALRDFSTHDLKYYTFGIVGPSKTLVDSLKRFNVTAVSLGCAVDEKQTCYNSVVDSIIFSKYQVRITDIR